jgi:AbrB family looped-hinge helix DNA binding protein
MKEIQTILTRKGQTTIPIEIRRALGLKEGDHITFVIEAGRVMVQRADNVVARTAGACRSAQPALTAEELRDSAEKAIAEDTAARQGG